MPPYCLRFEKRFVYYRTMSDGPDIAFIAALIGDQSRADILTALLAGRALTATELAGVTLVTKQTVSAHLGRLVDAGLIAVEQQGRHRYFRLADRDVADLLEHLMGVAYRSGAVRLQTGPREPALRKARVCYDHLAGDVGVLLFEALGERGLIRHDRDRLEVTAAGAEAFAELGLDLGALASQRRPLMRTCLDWSARRHHLGGGLGAALLDRSLALGWAHRSRNSRAIQFSPKGERALRDLFGISRLSR
jgi:DNA-binding transcriptional ArsR family regulator